MRGKYIDTAIFIWHNGLSKTATVAVESNSSFTMADYMRRSLRRSIITALIMGALACAIYATGKDCTLRGGVMFGALMAAASFIGDLIERKG